MIPVFLYRSMFYAFYLSCLYSVRSGPDKNRTQRVTMELLMVNRTLRVDEEPHRAYENLQSLYML